MPSKHPAGNKQCKSESLKKLRANLIGRPNYTERKQLPPLSEIWGREEPKSKQFNLPWENFSRNKKNEINAI
jgi:hypothetical protein